MTPRARIALATAPFLAALACSEAIPPATPGVIALLLTTPNADDGAISLVLTGPGVTSVASANSALVYWRVVSATEARVIVVGDLSNGVLATAAVAEANRLSGYHVEIVEVATRSDAVRASTASYAINVAASH